MERMRASVCSLLVKIPACPPVKTAAEIPCPHSSDTNTAAEIVSPQEASRSFSLAGMELHANDNRESVEYGSPFLPMAETTTTTWKLFCTACLTFSMQAALAEWEATEVPPNFITFIIIYILSYKMFILQVLTSLAEAVFLQGPYKVFEESDQNKQPWNRCV